MNIITMEDAAKYLRKTGTRKLLIDMTPDMTNSGCGCGKAKKYYTPYVRHMKAEETYQNYFHYPTKDVDIYVSPRAMDAASDTVTIRLEKTLFIKKLEVDGIKYIVE